MHRILSLNPKIKQPDCYWETVKPKLIKIGSLIKYLKDRKSFKLTNVFLDEVVRCVRDCSKITSCQFRLF